MERLIEQPVGEGELYAAGERLGRVHYHLSIYQHFSEDGELIPSNLDAEGRITAFEDVDIPGLHQLGVELTLWLGDGRALDFRIADETGTIHSTARGLYTPE